MSDENRILRTIYLTPAMDIRIRTLSFKLDVSKSEVMMQLMERGLQLLDDSLGETISEETKRLQRAQYRKARIEELTAIVDAEFDERWKKIKAAILADPTLLPDPATS